MRKWLLAFLTSSARLTSHGQRHGERAHKSTEALTSPGCRRRDDVVRVQRTRSRTVPGA